MELYPRRRITEFYHEPLPSTEYQSRQGEHPQDKLTDNLNNSRCDEEVEFRRIMPPRNSDMRLIRNSYFS